jgi:hypothetical protein
MKVEQISIFLAEVTGVLAKAGVNIRALSLADTADFGILRLIVNNSDRAQQILKESGFTVAKTNVIALEVPDSPGGLAGILSTLDKAGINVEYMYAFVQRSGDNAIIIFRFDELDKATRVLQDAGVRVLRSEEVYAL